MKKLIIATVVASAIASSAFAQGFVNLSGGVTTATKMSTNSVAGGPSTGLTTATGTQPAYYYALFATSSSTVAAGFSSVTGTGTYAFNDMAAVGSGWELVGIATNQLSAGRFVAASQGTSSAQQAALNTDGSLSVAGIAGANTAYLIAVGWSATDGTTLAAMESWYNNGSPATVGWLGESGVATVTLGDGGSNATPNPFGTTSGLVGGILMGDVNAVVTPEPGTMALAALGGASLLLFRRKK